MSKLRVNAFAISIDGYGAGPDQSLNDPMGAGGMKLHNWVFGTKTFVKMHADFAGDLIGGEPPREDLDDAFAARGFENVGAWILGRNMFGPVRGPWPDDEWSDVWDDEEWNENENENEDWSDVWDDEQDEGVFRWSGRVDIGAEIAIRGNSHDVRDQGGSGTQEIDARFSQPLPRSDVPVNLRKIRGRGRIELLQTPSARNNYVAKVRIVDEKSGADDYEFELTWRR